MSVSSWIRLTGVAFLFIILGCAHLGETTPSTSGGDGDEMLHYLDIPEVPCSSGKLVSVPGGEIALRGWAGDGKEVLEWSVQAGEVRGKGQEAIWILPKFSRYYTAKLVTNEGAEVCSLEVRVRDGSKGPYRFTRKAFLVCGEGESEGFGLYSYLLLGSKPNANNKERYLAVIKAYFAAIKEVEEFQELKSRRTRNVTYLPVRSLPPEKPPDDIAVWALENYDYYCAETLLALYPTSLRRGPYIISHSERLTVTNSLPDEVLFQNMTWIPEHLAPLWIEEFMKQAEQKEYWTPQVVARIARDLRTILGVIAEALPGVRAALSEWIQWAKSAERDSKS